MNLDNRVGGDFVLQISERLVADLLAKAVAAGQSCEGAIASYKGDEVNLAEGRKGPADLTAGAYGSILNTGTYLNACGVPSSMGVSICAAVQSGRAVGVTVLR